MEVRDKNEAPADWWRDAGSETQELNEPSIFFLKEAKKNKGEYQFFRMRGFFCGIDDGTSLFSLYHFLYPHAMEK